MSMGGQLHSSDPRVGEKAVLDVFPSRKGALEALIVGVSSRRGKFIPSRESFKLGSNPLRPAAIITAYHQHPASD